jgi:hypothetical protein
MGDGEDIFNVPLRAASSPSRDGKIQDNGIYSLALDIASFSSCVKCPRKHARLLFARLYRK